VINRGATSTHSTTIDLFQAHLVLPKYVLSIAGYSIIAVAATPLLSLKMGSTPILTFSSLTLSAIFESDSHVKLVVSYAVFKYRARLQAATI
jgi:hypothetical protein